MKTIYKTAEEMERENLARAFIDPYLNTIRTQGNALLSSAISMAILICLSVGLYVNNSMVLNAEIKALKATIQACEARPACKREIEK